VRSEGDQRSLGGQISGGRMRSEAMPVGGTVPIVSPAYISAQNRTIGRSPGRLSPAGLPARIAGCS